MNKIAIKPIKYYIIFLILGLGGYTYAIFSGIPFFNDRVEKNTEYTGRRGGVYINRFYHK